MKIRTDFVTNSSSSSFIALKFESNTLCEIFERFQKEIVNEKGERHPCAGFDVYDGIVEYREDESGYWDDGPEKLHESLNLLISLMYRWGFLRKSQIIRRLIYLNMKKKILYFVIKWLKKSL